MHFYESCIEIKSINFSDDNIAKPFKLCSRLFAVLHNFLIYTTNIWFCSVYKPYSE